MLRCVKFFVGALGVLALIGLSAVPANAAGFGIFEQGTKAMGMAGAFTAQADDPSAIFHNPGGLGFMHGESDILVGVTLIGIGDSEFQGFDPFPGSSATGSQKSQIVTPIHAYYVKPMNERWTFGFGANNPFGLITEWENPDTWAGRFLSNRAELRVLDLNPTLGWQATPNLGIGFGVIARFTDVTLERHAPFIDPFTFSVLDVAEVDLEGDVSEGFGFNFGLLHRVNNSFSWGFSYRGAIEVDYEGEGRLTQIATGNPQIDAVVATRLPFGRDLPIETSIEFPDMASLGLAFALSPKTLLEVDANWTGWSTFDQIDLVFLDAPALTTTIPEDWDDVMNYRVGLRWAKSSKTQWRFGYVFDETPQPEETVSPLLPGSDRNGYTFGVGVQGNKYLIDLAGMYLPFDDRETRVQESNFNGSYQTNAWLVGLSVGW